MSGYCKDCPSSRWDGGEGKYFCTNKYKFVDDFDYCYDHPYYSSNDDDDNDNSYSYGDDDSNSDDYSVCYITTATCNILGMDDDNEYLNTLRKFRNDIMKKNIKYHKMLVLYDIVGPKISKSLINDPNKLNISNVIMNKVKSSIMSINNHNYDEAISKYYEMTKGLASYYGIVIPEISDDLVNSFNIEKSGTGKVYKKIR